MSYRRSSNSQYPNRYHHVVVRHAETVVTNGGGADRQYIHMDSHPPKRVDNQFSGGYEYALLDPPQVRNPDLMMMVANDLEYNNWERPHEYRSNRQNRIGSFERHGRPSFESGYNASRASSGEELVDAEADDFIMFEHRKFEQESRKGSVRAG